MNQQFYRIQDVCVITGMGRSYLYEEIAQGHLKVVYFGKSARIPEDQLRAYLNRVRSDAGLTPIESDA